MSAMDLVLITKDLPNIDTHIEDREETQWIMRAKTGDDAAFLWLLQRYRRRMVRLAARILHRDADAEDIAQDAFIKAFREIRKLHNDQRFHPWLCRIVVRLCLDRKRLSKWNVEISGESVGVDHYGSCSFSDMSDHRVLVEMLLEKLSPPMRAVLVLRELEELTYEEVAQILDIPVGTVRSRLNTARAQFKQLWLASQKEADHA